MKLGPLLTLPLLERLTEAARAGVRFLECSLDLERTRCQVELDATGFRWQGTRYPFPQSCRDRTVYYWSGSVFEPVARYAGSLIKLVPTEWGAPTFEIDGIKMLPTARVSPWEDAATKVDLVRPKGRIVLDTCGGLGYFAAWCLGREAARVLSFEKSAEVIWLRSLNPWSPPVGNGLELTHADVVQRIPALEDQSVDAILHDPPRFGIAGELYSQSFYDQLFRVLRRRGALFHYTGAPNRLTSHRDVPAEVTSRLRRAGFDAKPQGDGVLAVRR